MDGYKCAYQRYNTSAKGKAARARYKRTEKGKKAQYAAVQRWRTRNPVKARAHWVVSKAIGRGKLARPGRCEGCGRQCKPQAHHADYSRPYKVQWLYRLGKTMEKEELNRILDLHSKWLKNSAEGVRADLSHADLSHADLSHAKLSHAKLSYADLFYADLSRADLSHADLSGAKLSHAKLSCADLFYADLSHADLSHAKLSHAKLSYADLSGAKLYHANLSCANLSAATLPDYQICPEYGAFDAWKAVTTKAGKRAIIKVRIPARAKRTSCLTARKCRAEFVKVLEGEGYSPLKSTQRLHYKPGKIVKADSFDDDIRVECSHGIHFFITKKEAEQF